MTSNPNSDLRVFRPAYGPGTVTTRDTLWDGKTTYFL